MQLRGGLDLGSRVVQSLVSRRDVTRLSGCWVLEASADLARVARPQVAGEFGGDVRKPR